MKLRRMYLTGTLLAVATALGAFASSASACEDRGSGDGYRSGGDRHRYEGRHAHAAARWDDQGSCDDSGRSYFYREVATGRTNSHISALRPRWGCRGNSPVERIDRRTGRLLGSYIWDGDSWEKCGRGDYGRYEGRGRGDYGRYEGRGRGYDRYAANDDNGY